MRSKDLFSALYSLQPKEHINSLDEVGEYKDLFTVRMSYQHIRKLRLCHYGLSIHNYSSEVSQGVRLVS